jgi:hypothetical protein
VTNGSAIPEPVAAATVLLLREEPAGGFSVFMVKRSMKSILRTTVSPQA